MEAKNLSSVEKRKAEDTVGKEVTFTKRSRGKKARKRQRTSPLDEEKFEHPSVRPPPRNESGLKENKQWAKQTFESGKESGLTRSNATAERLDIGGDKKSSAAEKSKKPFGPLSAPSHLRTSVRVDYQPDVCKDYKETGYCGFGDSCKFLHDRSDYKAGWQLDREWAEKEKLKTDKVINGKGSSAEDKGSTENELDDDGLPFACFVCRENFKMPVMSLCAHYFCEECILKHMDKSSLCPICAKPLRGTLNPAPKLRKRLEQSHK